MKKLFWGIKDRFIFYTSWLFQKVLRAFVKIDSRVLVFVPRGGGMMIDGYDYFNYTSDNALALLHYMVETYKDKYVYRLACDKKQYDKLHSSLKGITSVDIDCFPYFGNKKCLSIIKYKPLIEAKYVFMSETLPLYTKKRSQIVVFLNYFVPFKDDYGHEGHTFIKMNNLIDYSITTSRLSSYIISVTYDISFSKCLVMGFSRNDCLLSQCRNDALERFVKKTVNYVVKKVILYTPTYRDYEKEVKTERGLFGFDVNKDLIGEILKKNNAIILCKIHSTQNKYVIEKNLPEGVIIYPSNSEFGLCELMQRADCLITDYTSTYFDYLLLNRPVMFNFYDYDVYKDYRGFSYDPLEPFLAGDIFTNEESFIESLSRFFEGIDNHADQRRIIRDIHHKYQDNKSSQRICNFFFIDDKGNRKE